MVCQCPRRAILISTIPEKILNTDMTVGCQCPRRAILISTIVGSVLPFVSCVSMPSAGYSHFYTTETMKCYWMYLVCQCPRRAILISTLWKKDWILCGTKRCVNALGGLFSFLLFPIAVLVITDYWCVNALGGLFSFLQ